MRIRTGVQTCALPIYKAYEDKLLRGRAMIAARRLVEVRKRSGKASKLKKMVAKGATTPEGLLKAFQEDTERKRMMIRKTGATRNRLVFIVPACGQLSNGLTFVALLEHVPFTSLPTRRCAHINTIRNTQQER